MSAHELPTLRPFFGDKEGVVQEILGRYPDYGRRSAIMPLLWEVQNAERHVSPSRVDEIAEILGLTATEVRAVMSFYSSYHDHPVGAYHLQVCATLSCSLAGADELYAFLVDELGIVNGETDAEGRFSIQKVECLGSCGSAPVVQVNDVYYERVTRSRCGELLDGLRRDAAPVPWRERGGDAEAGDPAAAEAAAEAARGGRQAGDGEDAR